MVLTSRLVALSLVLLGAACGSGPRAEPRAALPELTLSASSGGGFAVPADLGHAPFTVVVFYADHCPCFRAHEARLREIEHAYGPRGVRLVLVDSEVSGTREGDARAASERGLPAIALDPGAKLADALGAEYATFTVVLDPSGRVRYRGGIDSDKNRMTDDARFFLRDALDDLLAGREPRVAEGKTLGCALMKR
ncbi:MAG: putative secreted protein [Labilithrix sp.]|nr:putative secreted protein [Labilithrix sp.]